MSNILHNDDDYIVVNEPDKTETLKFNSIPEQRLTYSNQLTLQLWNEYINMLRTQANELVARIKEINTWLFNPDNLINIEGWYDFVNNRLQYLKTDLNYEMDKREQLENTFNSDIKLLTKLYGVSKLHYAPNDSLDTGLISDYVCYNVNEDDTNRPAIYERLYATNIDF